MDKYQVRSALNITFPIGYNSTTGNIFIDTTGASIGNTLVYTSSGVVWQAPSGGTTTLVVGTTPISSGTVGRILFEGAGNVLQESSNLFWDNTNGRLSLGFGASPSARLDILNTGTTASDLAFRVRDNGNTFNNFEIRGNGVAVFAGFSTIAGYFVPYSAFGLNSFIITTQNLAPNTTPTNAAMFLTSTDLRVRAFDGTNSRYVIRFTTEFSGGDTDWTLTNVGNSIGGSLYFGVNGTSSRKFFITPESAICVGGLGYQNNGTNQLRIPNGTAPSSATLADSFYLYAADIVAGNSAPHFKTENGSIIKLYTNSAVTSVQGIANALTNNGLLATSTIYSTPTLFVQTASNTISNTTSELTLFGTGTGTLTVPANLLAVGTTIRIKLSGYMNEASTPTVRIRLKLGGTTIYDSTAVTINALGGTDKYVELIYDITCRTTGVTGTVFPQGRMSYTSNSGVVSILDGSVTSSSTINTTTTNVIDFTLEWGTASTSNNITITNAFVQVIN